MNSLFLDKNFTYTGPELRTHFLYEHGLKGDGFLSWVGPCEVKVDSMVDMEDRVNKDHIFSELMLHIVGEFFHKDIFYGIFVQRFIAEKAKELLCLKTKKSFVRRGDDVYLEDKKLNVSIATVSPLSALVHFGINISSKNTPLKTIGFEDLSVDVKDFNEELLKALKNELQSIDEASKKVKPV
jgi:hypothetical protein